jgi:hypothetical protein
VFRQLGGVLVDPTRIDFFKCTRHLLMESDAAWGDDLVIQRLTKECVAEAVRNRRADGGMFLRRGLALPLEVGAAAVRCRVAMREGGLHRPCLCHRHRCAFSGSFPPTQTSRSGGKTL